MKVRFFQRLNTRLLLPVFIILIVYIAGGFGLYYSGLLNSFKDFHRQYLISISTEKKLIIDSWFEYRKKDLNRIANFDIVRNNAALAAKAPDDIPPRMKKAVDDAMLNLSLFLEDYASDIGYSLLAVLSPDGKVLADSIQDIEGEDWPAIEFFKKKQDMDTAGFIGFHRIEIRGEYFYIAGFAAPVINEHGDAIAFIYTASNISEIVSLLKTNDTAYKSKKIKIIDGAGNVLLAEEGVPSKKIRYNIELSENVFGYKDGLFFYTTELDAVPLHIISTLDGSEVRLPFTVILIAYIAFAGIIIISAIIQRTFFSRSVLKPTAKLAKATQSAAIGNMSFDTGKGYTGEMHLLKRSFEEMLEGIKQREHAIRESVKTAERSTVKAKIFAGIYDEIKTPLSILIDGLYKARAEICNKKEQKSKRAEEQKFGSKEISNFLNFLNGAICSAKSIQLLIDNLIEYVWLVEGKITVHPEEFNLCKLFEELQDVAREMTGSKEIEVIMDCHDLFSGRPVNTDRYRLKQILTNLMDISTKSIDTGTVTVIASLIALNSIDYAEISVAGIGECAGEWINTKKCEYEYVQGCAGFMVSKRLTGMLGGKLTDESSEGRGIVFTLTIPIKTVTSNK
jgi:signal transduction histidine kinase